MRKSLIISPHSDDGIFSLGSFIPELGDVIIVSPFDGVPEDPRGKQKHTVLNQEHKEACACYDNVKIISGMFFDDVYHERRNLYELPHWFKEILLEYPEYDTYVPLGIHHPDHIIVRDIFIRYFCIDYFYEELPYYIRWPYMAENLRMLLLSSRQRFTKMADPKKHEACRKYASQVEGEVLMDLMSEERIWK